MKKEKKRKEVEEVNDYSRIEKEPRIRSRETKTVLASLDVTAWR